MHNSESISQQIALFCSLKQARRLDDGALRILESVLISRDVKSLLDVQRSLRDFLRHESVCVLRELTEISVDHKLLILEFLVRAFAIIFDLESCLALRYEALVLRELNSVVDQQLQVSYREWFTFAEQAIENKFYAIAKKACEKALACFQTNDALKTKDTDALFENLEAIRKLKRMKDLAIVRTSSQSVDFMVELSSTCIWRNVSWYKLFCEKSVQAQTVEYLKRKIAEHDKASSLAKKEKQHSASFLFRSGIKKHNARQLQELKRQRL